MTDIFSFIFWYKTKTAERFGLFYTISDYWINYDEGDLPTKINDKVIELVYGEVKNQLGDKLKQ